MVTKPELMQKVKRFTDIGKEIADLSEESRKLRKEIAEAVDELKLGRVEINDTEPVEFLIGNILVSVVKAKGSNDYTILSKTLVQLEELS